LKIKQESNKKKQKKESITLSFDKFVLDDIRKDAANAGVSVNHKVNEILKDYVLYQKMIIREHPVITFPPLFANLIKYVSEEAIIETFLMGIEQQEPFLVALLEAGGTPIDTLRRLFEFGLRIGLYENFTFVEKVGYFTLIFSHRYGVKWSNGISISFTKMIERVLNVHPISEITPEKVILRIPGSASASIPSYNPSTHTYRRGNTR
jgi:hypothetical protein